MDEKELMLQRMEDLKLSNRDLNKQLIFQESRANKLEALLKDYNRIMKEIDLYCD